VVVLVANHAAERGCSTWTLAPFSMNALLTAIFDGNPERVRELAVSHPELLSERSTRGLLPFDFARTAGYVPAAAVLLRVGAPGTDKFEDHAALLESYIRDLSDSHACAGWLKDIEFLVWCACEGDVLPFDDTNGVLSVPREQLQDIRFLSMRCKAWPYWDAQEGCVCMVSLTRWQHLYSKWRART
jgi:hypothetical protein